MGRVLVIGVIVIGVLFVVILISMNKETVKLPQIITNDLSSKETQNLSNYALRYAMQFASSQHFPEVHSFNRVQRFNNFFYKYGYIDSIRYTYVPSADNFKVKAYTRTTYNGQNASHVAVAAIGGINAEGGTGNILHYGFDNNFIDSSPNHNDGIDHGSIRFKTNGINSSCIWPDGNNDWVEINDNNSLDLPSTFSIVGWPNWNSNPNGWIPILWKPLPVSNTNYPLHCDYGLWIYEDHLYGAVTTVSNNYIQVSTPGTVRAQGNWHLAVMTYGQGYMKLYYDGELVAQIAAPNEGILNSDQDLQFLAMPTADGIMYFKGRFDEFGIYDYTLTAQQVANIWNSPSGILPVVQPNPYIVYLKE
ncbi:MAG TPA: LamG domain-containing protein [Candidatus Cloacimonadota bacterium]|nr:LamG domain-containing protein [Candidatus Cloacimonadota bacterium]HPT71450.1 LamG domain-containing protein [Candidatus Cloacimonadota bacterium]